MKKKIRVLALAMSLVLGVQSNIVWAAEAIPEKDENIYVKLKQDGSVNGIYVVNAYDVIKKTTIIDYGTYSSVKNLTSDAEIKTQGDRIQIEAEPGKFFYQGNIEDGELPWNIKISYYLDGKKYDPEEIAGKSGKLEIRIQVEKNDRESKEFFDNYLLQATVVMDMEKCKNLEATGAVEGNVGTDRQLVYNIMAGCEKEILIKADVTEFEMDAINFLGVPMSFDLDRESFDLDSLYDKTDEVKDAAAELDEGAGKLNDGTGELKEGAWDLYEGADQLHTGTGELYDGVGELQDGAKQLKEGADTLKNGIGNLKGGLENAKNGVDLLGNGIGSLGGGIGTAKAGADALAAGFAGDGTPENPGYQAILARMQSGIAGQIDTRKQAVSGAVSAYGMKLQGELQNPGMAMGSTVSGNVPGAGAISEDYMKGYSAGIGYALTQLLEMQKQLGESGDTNEALQPVFQQLDVYMGQLYAGTLQLQSGLNELQLGADKLNQSTGQLRDGTQNAVEGTGKLYAGANELYAGSDSLYGGSDKLKNGAAELKNGALELKDGGKELYDGTIELKDGADSLKDGTDRFKEETADIDIKIDDEIDSMIEEFSGKEYEPISYVSDKNEKVGLVQFVISTEEIKEKEAEEVEVVTEEKTFFQKLKDLF